LDTKHSPSTKTWTAWKLRALRHTREFERAVNGILQGQEKYKRMEKQDTENKHRIGEKSTS
jgi:hypothetical protein